VGADVRADGEAGQQDDAGGDEEKAGCFAAGQ
jgi:hypothetical protein